MNRALPQEVLLIRSSWNTSAFAAAPQKPSSRAWKRGVTYRRAEWFGDGLRDGLQRATTSGICGQKLLMLNDASAS